MFILIRTVCYKWQVHLESTHDATPPECVTENDFSYFSTKTYVVGTQNNHLDEHQKHMFKLMNKKIITILHQFFFCVTGTMVAQKFQFCMPEEFFPTKIGLFGF